MNLGWVRAALSHVGNPHVWPGLLLFAASAVLIPLLWYRVRKKSQRRSSIQALEALFALPDPRESGANRRRKRS